VRAIDKAGDVGGTWWWNRYPGARFDSEAYIYHYHFDEKLYKDWSWSEKFPGHPEVEQWLQYVTDRLDLRKDIQFSLIIRLCSTNGMACRSTRSTARAGAPAASACVTASDTSSCVENQFDARRCSRGTRSGSSRESRRRRWSANRWW